MNRIARPATTRLTQALAWAIAILLPIGFACLPSSQLVAEEPAEAFLEALRENEYFDVAMDYLNSVEQSKMASPAFLQSIPFEKAETLISSTSRIRDLVKLKSTLDEAEKLLSDFATQVQSPEALGKTLRYQGNLHYSRAKVFGIEEKNDRLTAAEKDALRVQAREQLQKARASYDAALKQILELIDPTKKSYIQQDPADPSTKVRLKQFQFMYTLIRQRIPMVIEQMADTYSANAPEYKTLLAEAAKNYAKVYDDYYNWPAGQSSCLFAARCHQKLGQHKQAIDLLEELFGLPDSSRYTDIKRQAYLAATESWGKLEKYPFEQVVARLGPVIELLNSREVRQPDWQRIQIELAIAQHQMATATKDKKLDASAAKILKTIVRVPGPHRDQANALLSEWKIDVTVVIEDVPVKTFKEAVQRASDSTKEIEALISDANKLRREIAAANEAEQKTKAAELDDLQLQIEEFANKALGYLSKALNLVDQTTVRAEINNVRYLQSFCYFAMQQYLESALIGKFLLDKYPTVDGTRNAMVLLVQSLSLIHSEAADDDKIYELGKLNDVCVSIVEQYPQTKEGGMAASRLVQMGIIDKDYLMAEKYIAAIPRDAEYLPGLASQLGQQIWFDYKKKLPITAVNKQEMASQLEKAIEFLRLGAESATLKDLNHLTALGSLLLVEAYLEAGETEKAIFQLETAEVAPIDLVKQKHVSVTQSPIAGFYDHETYKIAVKVYLAGLKGSQGIDQQRVWIEKANGVIQAMREGVDENNDSQARQRITLIYRLIAAELKSQFEGIQSNAEKVDFAGLLAGFLGSIEKDSSDARTILWAGSALMTTANSLNESGLTTEAKPLFAQAVSALSRAETLGFAGDDKAAEYTSELRRQRALAQRGSGNYEAAVELFADILRENAKSLQVQIDAAETLSAWGKAAKRDTVITKAIMGSHLEKDKATGRDANLIWGWQKLAKATRGNEKFADTFYRSLYYMSEGKLEYALIRTDKKEGALKAALQEIENAEQRDPEIGGPSWKPKFEALKKRIKENQ